MPAKVSKEGGSIEVRVEIAARVDTVFRFLFDPERFVRWMGEGSSIEVREGGALVVTYPTGETARGRIVEMTPNERLVFTWGYADGEHGLEPGATTVTVELSATKRGTLVRLRHEGLPTDQLRRNHTLGWRHYLSQLANAAADEELSGRLEAIVTAYCEAWNETDPTTRLTRLAECWDESGVFQDAMACVKGLEALSDHIGAAQAFSQGAQLVRTEEFEQCQGFVRFRWRAVTGGGIDLAQGWNYGELNAQGLLCRIVGFVDPPGRDD